MRARVVQMLCPRQHAILCLVINEQSISDDEAKAMIIGAVDMLIAKKGEPLGLPINELYPWCGICGASRSQWFVDVQWSRDFSNWDEAVAAANEAQHSQLLGRAIMEIMGSTYDSFRKRSVN